jgi:hypothetical protein
MKNRITRGLGFFLCFSLINIALVVTTFAGEVTTLEERIEQARPEQGWTVNDLVNYVGNDLNQFWAGQFGGTQWQYAPPAIFTGYTTTIQTQCGPIKPNNAVYCSGDHGIYYDVNLMQQLLTNVGDYGVAAVIAHEWGHLVQNLIGVFGAGFPTIITELQADCLTGIYTISVDNRGLLDINDIDEAARVLFLFGDDLPLMHPNAHGTPQMRHESFVTGFRQGFDGCGIDAVTNRINGGGGGTPAPPPIAPPPIGNSGGLQDYDFDGDCFLNDVEFFSATDSWLAGQISDITFFSGLDAWIGQSSVCLVASGKRDSITLKVDPNRVIFESRETQNHMHVQIMNSNGQILFDRKQTGSRLAWNMSDASGSRVANGVYFYRVTTTNSDGSISRSEVKKLVILN